MQTLRHATLRQLHLQFQEFITQIVCARELADVLRYSEKLAFLHQLHA